MANLRLARPGIGRAPSSEDRCCTLPYYRGMTDTSFEADSASDDPVYDETEQDDSTLYETAPSSLPYFGADFDVAGLVRRLNEGDIVIPRFDPDESADLTIDGFQRQRVWTTARMEKFVESLLLGWPVPSIFLVVEPDGRYLVLDGQQRLTTLQSFYNGTHPDGRVFRLKDVVGSLEGATFETLTNESKRRLNNTFIQAVVIEPTEDGREAVYRLFGRLNSGGVTLTAQEIRVALYRGPLVDFIRDLNQGQYWRLLFGTAHKKLKDHELILRALAMANVIGKIRGRWNDQDLRLSAYKPPMAQFLNGFLDANGDLSEDDPAALTSAFEASCKALYGAFGRDGLRLAGRMNAAHIDSVLGALIYAHLNDIPPGEDDIKRGIAKLRADSQYQDWVSRSTSHRDSVFGRLKSASTALVG